MATASTPDPGWAARLRAAGTEPAGTGPPEEAGAGDRPRWRPPVALLLAALVGAAAAIAVDRLVLGAGDGESVGTGDVALTPEILGSDWSLETTVDLGGGDDAGLLNGCTLTGGLAGDDPGSFNSLRDGTGDALTNEVRVAISASHAAEVFDAATSIEAVECVRAAVESAAAPQLAPGTPVGVVEPLDTTPWADQAMAFRVRIDIGGIRVQHTDVHVLRTGRAIAVVQVLDQGDPMAPDLPVKAVRAVLDGMARTFGRD